VALRSIGAKYKNERPLRTSRAVKSEIDWHSWLKNNGRRAPTDVSRTRDQDRCAGPKKASGKSVGEKNMSKMRPGTEVDEHTGRELR
jgi:hypothetical protein